MFALDLYKRLSTLELTHQYTNEWRKKSLLSEVKYHLGNWKVMYKRQDWSRFLVSVTDKQ